MKASGTRIVLLGIVTFCCVLLITGAALGKTQFISIGTGGTGGIYYPYGGGVAEILYSYVPLLRGTGIKADWRIISADEPFFSITKAFHNVLSAFSQ